MSTLIMDKVDGFIQDMNRELTTYRKQLEAGIEEEKTEKRKVPVVTFVRNNNPVTKLRKPKQHVESLINNRSWTFTSRHLNDSARHILIKFDGMVNWAIDKKETWKPYDLDKIKRLWEAHMEKHGLRNYKGQKGWGSGDVLHFELAESTPPLNHPSVKKVIELYIEETRIKGRKKNEKLERKPKFKRAIEKYL